MKLANPLSLSNIENLFPGTIIVMHNGTRCPIIKNERTTKGTTNYIQVFKLNGSSFMKVDLRIDKTLNHLQNGEYKIAVLCTDIKTPDGAVTVTVRCMGGQYHINLISANQTATNIEGSYPLNKASELTTLDQSLLSLLIDETKPKKLFTIEDGFDGWAVVHGSFINAQQIIKYGFELHEGRLYPDDISTIKKLLGERLKATEIAYHPNIRSSDRKLVRQVKIERVIRPYIDSQ